MDAHEVEGEVDRERVDVVRQLLREGVRQPGEPGMLMRMVKLCRSTCDVLTCFMSGLPSTRCFRAPRHCAGL